MEKILWHALPLTKVFSELETDKHGLKSTEVEKRLKKNGLNKLPEEKKFSGISILLAQFKSPLIFVLVGAAIISFLLRDAIDTAIILIAIFINTILGFYQENKASKAVAYLKKLINLKAKILRDGQEIEISAEKIVPGDIIFLEPGDKIPADCRLIKIDNLEIIEASLTGESAPSDKNSENLEKGTPLADRENMVYSGTIVSKGKGLAVVCNTGINTELGQITQMVTETPEGKTPLQQQLSSFSATLTYIVIAICAIIVTIGKFQGRTIFGFGDEAREGMLNTAAAIAVAAIPEGLLISVTAILALGMQAILRHKALVRKLIAAETLGSVSIICTDKTGTLTEGEMQVSQIVTLEQDVIFKKNLKYQNSSVLKNHDLILKICLLCNDAVIENPNEELQDWKILGGPTEKALLLAAIQSGIPIKELKKQQPRLLEIPFDSEIKYMATLNELDKAKNVVYVKGAPEKILEMSTQLRMGAKKESITDQKLKILKSKYEKFTSQGLRVLAFAYKQIPADDQIELADELNDLIFIGFVALKDPLRPETKETFELARQAGIRPIIITGDHKLTAKAIVLELGLKVNQDNILTGDELDKISDDELAKKIKNIDIYARVEPRHKLRIISAWQKSGEIVAMTGDGINDAPAIKAADIGIALGSGTDVAKETSDMILLDNNFKTIIAAVEQGRVIFDNIKKVILYLLSDSFSEMILIIGALLLNMPLPILPAQIIWINLIADGLPNLALTFEPGEKEVMKEKPRKKNEKILDKEMKILIFIIGICTNLILLALFIFLLTSNQYTLLHIRTLIFAVVGIDSLLYVFSCRSLRHSVWTKNPFSNLYLLVAVVLGFILMILAIQQPHLQKIFNTESLELTDWLLVVSLSVIQIIGIEITKYYFIVTRKDKRTKNQNWNVI